MKTGQRSSLTLALMVTSCLLAWPLLAAGPQHASPDAATTWTRSLEPVIVTGDQLPLFDGIALDELFVYAYTGGSWQPVPFQFDKVDANGAYSTGTGLLDANDELVLMAMDLGDEAGVWQWIADADSRNHPRYQVQVTNPLLPTEQGWAYVYRSTTMVPTPLPDYVRWDTTNEQIAATTYKMGFDPASHAGVESLELNGSGVDVMDRTKIRLTATCETFVGPIAVTLTEEDLTGLTSFVPDIDGLVRLGGGTTEASAWAYASLFWWRASMDLADLTPPDFCTSLTVNRLRISNDWQDPALTGMAPAVYFDSNTPNGVPIDGVPDTVPLTPPSDWSQVSGGRGSTVQVVDLALDGGSILNYYSDREAGESGDTGDGHLFGDAGFRVEQPSGQVNLELLTFVLDPGWPNVGSTFRNYYAHPLQATAVAQDYDCTPAGVSFGWSPGTVAGVETTLTASVEGGQTPFTYAWTFGDDSSTAAGNPVTHTFQLTGTFPVTLEVANACGTAAPVIHDIRVFEPGGASLVHLPVAIKSYP